MWRGQVKKMNWIEEIGTSQMLWRCLTGSNCYQGREGLYSISLCWLDIWVSFLATFKLFAFFFCLLVISTASLPFNVSKSHQFFFRTHKMKGTSCFILHSRFKLNLSCMFHIGWGLSLQGSPHSHTTLAPCTRSIGLQQNMPQSRVWPYLMWASLSFILHHRTLFEMFIISSYVL